MTRTYQPCDECRGTNVPTKDVPTLTGPMRRLCGMCITDAQLDYAEQFAREDEERIERISTTVGTLLFDGLMVVAGVTVVGVVLWKWVLPWIG